MKCPTCGKPNREGAEFCGSCGDVLLEASDKGRNPLELVEVTNFRADIDAQLALTTLEAHGIQAAIFDETISGAYAYTGHRFPRIKVHRKDLEYARKLLGMKEGKGRV